jgi:predicted nuclease of predicted toxin-antitoxin system
VRAQITKVLRSAGHDVLAIVEVMKGAEDEAVIQTATKDDRVLLTEDSDFGKLVYVRHRKNAGVILIRFPNVVRAQKASAVLELVTLRGDRLRGNFSVLQPGRVRIGKNP